MISLSAWGCRPGSPLTWSPVLDAVRRDKKRHGEIVRFVLLRKIGEALIEDIPFGNWKKKSGS